MRKSWSYVRDSILDGGSTKGSALRSENVYLFGGIVRKSVCIGGLCIEGCGAEKRSQKGISH